MPHALSQTELWSDLQMGNFTSPVMHAPEASAHTNRQHVSVAAHNHKPGVCARQASLALPGAQEKRSGQQQAVTSEEPAPGLAQDIANDFSEPPFGQSSHVPNAASSVTVNPHNDSQNINRQTLKDVQVVKDASQQGKSVVAMAGPKTVRLQETARTGFTALQHYDSAPALTQASLLSGSDTGRRATSPTLLRNQHLPGVTMHQKTAFPANMTMKHEAGISSVAQGRRPPASLDALQPRAIATAPRAVASPTARPQSPTALHNQQLQQLWRQHSAAMPSKNLTRRNSVRALQRSDSAAPEQSAAAHVSSQASKQAAKLRRLSSIRSAHLPRKASTKDKLFIQPFYEATSHSLGRSQTWASQWLALGSPDELTDPIQIHSLPNPRLQHTDAASAASAETSVAQVGDASQMVCVTAPELTSHSHAQTVLQSSGKTAAADPDPTSLITEAPAVSSNTSQPQSPAVVMPHSGTHSNSTAEVKPCAVLDASMLARQMVVERPHTVPASTTAVLSQHWQLDLRRLHSARPGCGGSPTARLES